MQCIAPLHVCSGLWYSQDFLYVAALTRVPTTALDGGCVWRGMAPECTVIVLRTGKESHVTSRTARTAAESPIVGCAIWTAPRDVTATQAGRVSSSRLLPLPRNHSYKIVSPKYNSHEQTICRLPLQASMCWCKFFGFHTLTEGPGDSINVGNFDFTVPRSLHTLMQRSTHKWNLEPPFGVTFGTFQW